MHIRHLANPLMVPRLILLLGPVLLQTTPGNGRIAIQARKHFLPLIESDVGDVDEGIGKGRRSKLVVLCEGPCKDVEAQAAGLHEDVRWDVRCARVVDRQRERQNLVCQQRE